MNSTTVGAGLVPARALPRIAALTALAAIIAFIEGCAAVGTAVQIAGVATGQKALTGAGSSMKRSAEVEEFTEEEKFYTGRTVAAQLLASEQASEKTELEAYVGSVGQLLATASGKAELPEGWHFILLKDRQPNAYACPGGIVLLSEGLVELCQDEDELAGVLAHEIAHIAIDHPNQAISAANKKAALTGLASAAFSAAVKGSDAEKMVGAFDNIVGEVGKAVAHGYDRDKEEEADLMAVRITAETGYDPRGLKRVLARLKASDPSHGSPSERARSVEDAAFEAEPVPKALPARTLRFKKALGRS